jgi:hypothetical protein
LESAETAEESQHKASLARDLRLITADGAAWSWMVGLGETYLAAYALAVGLGQIASGLIATVPLLFGAMLQLISPTAVRWLKSHRAWVSGCCALQAVTLWILVALAWFGWANIPTVFAVAAVYWGAGLAGGPAWNTWVGRIIPPPMRARFFAQRTRLAQGCLLAGFVTGGIALDWGERNGILLAALSGVFLAAGVARFISAILLALQSEPEGVGDGARTVGLVDFAQRCYSSNQGKLLLYLLSVQAAVQISGPFFNPFILRQLEYTYFAYMQLIGCAYAAKVVALPFCGAFAHRYGARTLLWVGGVGILPLSGMWLFSQDYWFLVTVQVVGGFFWAAYELAMCLLFFEAIHERERTSVLTNYNLGHAMAVCLGSLVGGLVLYTLDRSFTAYLCLFGISALARIGTVGLLARVPMQVPAVPDETPAEALSLEAPRPNRRAILELVRNPNYWKIPTGEDDRRPPAKAA